jgi:hypothetical protein
MTHTSFDIFQKQFVHNLETENRKPIEQPVSIGQDIHLRQQNILLVKCLEFLINIKNLKITELKRLSSRQIRVFTKYTNN